MSTSTMKKPASKKATLTKANKLVHSKRGVKGKRLQEMYANYEEWALVSNQWNLASLLGFASPKAAWYENPMIQKAEHPTDYKVIK